MCIINFLIRIKTVFDGRPRPFSEGQWYSCMYEYITTHTKLISRPLLSHDGQEKQSHNGWRHCSSVCMYKSIRILTISAPFPQQYFADTTDVCSCFLFDELSNHAHKLAVIRSMTMWIIGDESDEHHLSNHSSCYTNTVLIFSNSSSEAAVISNHIPT